MSIPFEGIDLGPESQVGVRSLQIAWFDQWLKGKDSALLSKQPIQFFVMGANKWREEREWPPEAAKPMDFYLQSGGKANSLTGDGALADKPGHKSAFDTFEFDPAHPVPTRGGSVCCNPKVFPWGPFDQRVVEERKDVLIYSTKPLKDPVEVAGPVKVALWVSTNVKDTDFTAKLVDVFPDGTARNLTDGILRLRYRDSLEKPELAKPGELYRIVVDAGPTSNVFLKGHRIRLEVSSSNFPRFDRNPNTGALIADATRFAKANQIVFHDAAHPSALTLLVIK
jgi:putative CocE/NonD family hydrolase